jgi:oligopeptide transport system permease protein
MFKVVGWRLLQFPLVLAVIYVTTFLLVWVAPGSPFGNPDRPLDPIVEQALRERFKADSPASFLRYYPFRMLQGDMGPSLQHKEWSVNEILKSALPISVTLGLFAMIVATLVGVAVGTLGAVRRGGVFDWTSLCVALIGISFPTFVVASLLFLVFCFHLHWFPVGRWGSLRDMVLPGVALSLAPMAYIARLSRVAMIDTLSSDFVRTARAKGLSRSQVIWKHCLRNSFLPVLSFLGPAAATTLTGSFVVEKVFTIPGLGKHFVDSVLNRDQTLILGIVMLYSVFLLTFNLLVDIGYAFLDPRIDLSARGR